MREATLARAATLRLQSLQEEEPGLGPPTEHHFSRGNPVVAAESQLEQKRFREGVDGRWACIRATHVLAGRGGYTTRAEAELRGS